MERQHILKTTSYSPPKTVLTMEIQHKLQKTSPSPNHTKHGKTTTINKTPLHTRNGTNHGETTHITKTTPFPPETVLFTKKYPKKRKKQAER